MAKKITKAELVKENSKLKSEKAEKARQSKLWQYRAAIYNPNYGYNVNADVNGTSADASILQKLNELRKISLEAFANMPVAKAVINNIVAHTILDGITFTVDTDDNELNDELQTIINDWASSTECDASNNHNLNELIECALRTFLLYGEEYAMFVGGADEEKIQTKLRLVHPDRVGDPGYNTNKEIIGGIEVDYYGEEKAIYVQAKNNKKVRKTIRDSDGNLLIAHLFKKDFVDQHHGVPALTTCYPMLLDLATFIKSEVRAAANSSSINLMFHTDNPAARTQALYDNEGTDNSGSSADEINLPIIQADSGQMIPLLTHESISQLKLERPNGVFAPFVTEILKQICSSLGFAYEYLFMSFADSNFASARLSALTSQKELKRYQNLINQKLIKPLVARLAREVLSKGMVENKKNIKIDKIIRSINVVWSPFPLLDPGREIDWVIRAVEGNLMTLEDATMKIGGKQYIDILIQRARERQELEQLNLNTEQDITNPVGKPAGPDSTRG